MIGTQIGSFKILEKLGEGGMGVVYKAVDTSLDRVVAMKALSAELVNNPDLEKRFRAEAKAQAGLNHTNIATLYAFLVEGATAWMVMEFIEGESIADMLQRRGLIPWQEAVPIFKQALLGIGYAHRMGIVHRDIKPSNIMMNRQGIVKVMDFGIAKVMGNRGMTRTGTQMGTAYYMSPEQVVNKGVDLRSDIYSLGVTLYEMLTANVPFTGDTDFEVMQAHMQTPPPLPTRFYPYIPKGIENAVLQSIEKNQAARFQTVEEFGAALEHPEDYQPQGAAVGAAGPALAGGTRLEAPTQTMGPPRPSSSPGVTRTMQPAYGTGPGTPVPIDAAAPPAATPALPVIPGEPQWQVDSGLCRSRSSGGHDRIRAAAEAATDAYAARDGPGCARFRATAAGTGGSSGSGSCRAGPGVSPANNPQPQDRKKATPAAPPPQPAQTHQQETAQNVPPQVPAPQTQQQQQPPPAPASPPAPVPAAPAVTAPAVAAGSPLTIPAGTRVTVRLIGMASTRSSKEGDQIAASVDTSVVVGGRTAIARGAGASLRIASLEDGIVLDLASLMINGRHYPASAGPYTAANPTKDKKGNKVVRGLRHLDPIHRGSDQPAMVVSPDTRITFTLSRPVEVPAQ